MSPGLSNQAVSVLDGKESDSGREKADGIAAQFQRMKQR